MKDKYTTFLSILVLLIISTATLAFAETIPAFQLKASSVNIDRGDLIHVTVVGNDLADLYAFELSTAFDTDILEFVSVKSYINGYQVPVKVEDHRMTYAMSKTGNKAGENGTANLVTFTFRGKKVGNTKIGFQSIKILDSNLKSSMYHPNEEIHISVHAQQDKEENRDDKEEDQLEDKKEDTRIAKDSSGDVIIQRKAVVDEKKGTAVVTIDAKTLEDAFALADKDSKGKKKIVLEVPELLQVKEFIQELPIKAISALTNSVIIEIRTPVGTIQIPDNMLNAQELWGEETVRISLRKANISHLPETLKQEIDDRPVIEILALVGGKNISWNNPNAPVTISLGYEPTEDEKMNPEHIVVWYIDGKGNVVSVPNGRYDPETGMVTFVTTHFSQYAVAFVQRTFMDISNSWAKKEIEVLASKGIIKGMTENSFDPKKAISRADFIVLLIRTLELYAEADSGFVDVKPEDYYYKEVGIAKKLGITLGKDTYHFDPKAPISRQEMMVFTARALKIADKLSEEESDLTILQAFEDMDTVSAYAKDSIAALIDAKLIQGAGKNLLPSKEATREEIAVLMYKIYHK